MKPSLTGNSKYAAEFAELGVDWETVRDCFLDMKALDREDKDRERDIRQKAWRMATGRDQGWKNGFANRYGQQYAEGDQTCIKGYDLIQQIVASDYPEFETDEDALWQLLFSPCRNYATTAELYAETLNALALNHEPGEPAPF